MNTHPLFEQIRELAVKHPPTDSTWTSPSLQAALASDAKPASLLHDEHNHKFVRALWEALERRTLNDPEVRRLYLIAVKSESLAFIEWVRRASKRRGAKAYQEVADLLRASEWKNEESFIRVFDRIVFFNLTGDDQAPLVNYLLSWPDAFFLKLFSGEVSLDGNRIYQDYRWMVVFIERGQKLRLASLLEQIPFSNRKSLDSGAYTYLMAADAALFEPFVASAGASYLEAGHLRDAFETYQRLRQEHRESYADEMRETCLRILQSHDGDLQLEYAAEQLIPIAGKESIQPVLEWFNRPCFRGPGPWSLAPGGGRGSVLYYASAHLGPASFPLLEAALAKNDVELELECLECWTQFEHRESEGFIAERLGQIITDQELDEKHRLAAIQIGAVWNVPCLGRALLECLHDARRLVREAAARALGREGAKHLPLALEMLRSRKAPVRSVAVLLLELAAVPETCEEVMRAYHEEGNSGVADEMLLLLKTLSVGFSIELNESQESNTPLRSPKSLISRYKFSKVPTLQRSDGSIVSEFELHWLILSQWRRGRHAIASEAISILAGLDTAQADELAYHFGGNEAPHLDCPSWLKPLIALLCGPKTLDTSFLACSQDFWHRRVANALATVRILNAEDSEKAKALLEGYQKHYAWFSKLPWSGLDQGNLFESTF
jgi:hypothetical protein